VGDADDGIVLTEQEREVLAGLAATIGDPWLAGQLVGPDGTGRPRPRPPSQRRRQLAAALSAIAGRLGVLLLVAGAVLATTTFMHSTVVASLGLALMGVGVWRLVVERGDRILARLSPPGEGQAPQSPAQIS
jgi:hypothetical protein